MSWQLQEAKQKFSRVVQKAIDEGPQIVTRHGSEVVVVMSAQEYRRLAGRQNFKDFLLGGPDLSLLDLQRPIEQPRPVDL